jgi:hypothetical protein
MHCNPESTESFWIDKRSNTRKVFLRFRPRQFTVYCTLLNIVQKTVDSKIKQKLLLCWFSDTPEPHDSKRVIDGCKVDVSGDVLIADTVKRGSTKRVLVVAAK